MGYILCSGNVAHSNGDKEKYRVGEDSILELEEKGLYIQNSNYDLKRNSSH